jgi:peptidoglycan/xylan/chitin deacetylase (PgdA/CDA1 family)
MGARTIGWRPPLVLAYHCVGKLPRAEDPHNLMVPAEQLRRQLRGLLDRGYEFVTVSEFARRMIAAGPPGGVCALSFDDGSEDNAVVLPSLLGELGIPATLFVCPGLLGSPHPFLGSGAGVRLMSEDQLRDVAALPLIEIGSHTNTHPDLSNATGEEAYGEMEQSRRDLEGLIGERVHSFAYPFCRYSAACPTAARRAGYLTAVTCGARGGWRPYELRRASIDSLDGRLTFALKSRGQFEGLRSSLPGRLARRLARPLRHPGAG